VLVEGTAGIGKSTLVDHLVRRYLQQHTSLNTLLRLGQGHTYSPLDPDNLNSTLTAHDHIQYLERVYETLAFLAQPAGKPAHLTCVIETLHLTLAVRPGLLSQSEVLDYDHRLAALGCKVILIQVSPQTQWERCIWERRHNGFITRYGAKYGHTLEAIHAYYVREQTQLLNLFAQSSMEKLLLDGESAPEQLADQAYEFWISERR
jgi:hypothetical protein